MTETTQAPALKWKRAEFSTGAKGYLTKDDTYGFAISRRYGSWYLQVQELREVAGLKTPVGQDVIDYALADTFALVKAIAAQYSAFGPGYQAYQHGYQSRMSASIGIAYDLDKDGKL